MKNISRIKCLCCKKKTLSEIINLGLHSYADRFIPLNKKNLIDPKYPLIVDLCKSCKFIQLRIITNPKNRYTELDYSYTSSNSNYARNHWKNFTDFLENQTSIKGKNIIEIGSNDGFLISILKKKGANVLGVDASKFMVNLANKNNIKTVHSIFSFAESIKLKKKFGKADIIIANNVFNHSNDPNNFLKGTSNLLKKNGIFVFEQPNFTTGALSLKFDQIYHEHVSYFTVANIKSILSQNDFQIHHIKKNDYHGGSLRTIAIKDNSVLKKFDVNKLIKDEIARGIYKVSFYKSMMKKIDFKKKELLEKIFNLKKKNYIIAGIGAGAKANTFLTYYDLNYKMVNFLTDTSKYKQNKITPNTRIIIKDDKEIVKYKKITCIILSWNISKMIIQKLRKLNKKAKFIYT